LKRETQVTIIEQLTEDLKTSMRAGDTTRTGVVRFLKGALKNEEIKVGHPLDESEITRVLQREAKQRRDSIEQFKTAGRSDLAESEEAELKVVQSYLPETLSEAALAKIVDEAIAETGATDMKQMGAVIGLVMQRTAGSAEGGAVSKLVREKLS
jgi:uncharacterized protein YqeY